MQEFFIAFLTKYWREMIIIAELAVILWGEPNRRKYWEWDFRKKYKVGKRKPVKRWKKHRK